MSQRLEPVLVETAFPETSVERFYECVLSWLSGLYEVELDGVVL